MPEKISIKSWVLLVTLSLIWGSSFILIKKSLIGLSATEVGALRIFSAGLVMLPIAIKRIGSIPKSSIPFLFIVALVGSFIPSFLFAIAQTQMPSALVGVLNAVTPIFTILIGVLFYKQKKDPLIWIGIVIGFIGTAVLITNGSISSIFGLNIYSLLIILATILYAINGNIIKFHLSQLSATTIASITLVIGGLFSGLFLAFLTDFFSTIVISKEAQYASYYVVLLGVMGTALALIIFNQLVQLTDPVFTSSVTYIIPVVAILWGVWDGESLSNANYVGIGLILFGVYLANKLGQNKPNKKAD